MSLISSTFSQKKDELVLDSHIGIMFKNILICASVMNLQRSTWVIGYTEGHEVMVSADDFWLLF